MNEHFVKELELAQQIKKKKINRLWQQELKLGTISLRLTERRERRESDEPFRPRFFFLLIWIVSGIPLQRQKWLKWIKFSQTFSKLNSTFYSCSPIDRKRESAASSKRIHKTGATPLSRLRWYQGCRESPMWVRPAHKLITGHFPQNSAAFALFRHRGIVHILKEPFRWSFEEGVRAFA